MENVTFSSRYEEERAGIIQDLKNINISDEEIEFILENEPTVKSMLEGIKAMDRLCGTFSRIKEITKETNPFKD